MNETKDLATLAHELQALESETFEVRDYVGNTDLHMLPESCSTSSTSSTTSTCSCTG
jgi:thiazolylpeptide-type bacteriocin precursor